MSKRYLILSDGTVYTGEAFGATCEATGELVFNTGVVGYIETLTDPSYWGQIIMQTFPAVGNYGIIEEDFEGQCACRGYVVREWCPEPSNFRSQYDAGRIPEKAGRAGHLRHRYPGRDPAHPRKGRDERHDRGPRSGRPVRPEGPRYTGRRGRGLREGSGPLSRHRAKRSAT